MKRQRPQSDSDIPYLVPVEDLDRQLRRLTMGGEHDSGLSGTPERSKLDRTTTQEDPTTSPVSSRRLNMDSGEDMEQKEGIPPQGTFFLSVRDKKTGHEIRNVVKSALWQEIKAKYTVIHKEEEPEEFEGAAKSISVKIDLDARLKERLFDFLCQYLEQGPVILVDAQAQDLRDLRNEVARPLEMLQLANAIEQVLHSPSENPAKRQKRTGAGSEDALQAVPSSEGDVSDHRNTELTEERAREMDKQASYTAGLNPRVQFVIRAQSSITSDEFVSLAHKLNIVVHMGDTDKFKERYLEFISVVGLAEGFELKDPKPIDEGHEVEQTLPAAREWWREMEKRGVKRWTPLPVTKTACGFLYQTRFPGTTLGQKPLFVRGCPDLLTKEKPEEEPAMIFDDKYVKLYKSGKRLFKVPFEYKELQAIAEQGRLDQETKPTKAPVHSGQVLVNNIAANAASSAGPVATLRTDFGIKFDIALVEYSRGMCHIVCYENLPPILASAFVRVWLLAEPQELPRRCIEGHRYVRSKLTAEQPTAAEIKEHKAVMKKYREDRKKGKAIAKV